MYRLNESPSTSLSSKSSKILTGLFAECDTLNQNERIYPSNVYMPALDELLPKIREGRLLGELDHPSDRDEVCLSNVSHVIKECRVDGNKIYGTVELLDTPAGKIAQALKEAGIPLGISSRGLGNTRRINAGNEVTDFKLITFDLVADPSFSNAILSESAKVRFKSRLDDIERTLPMNESVGDSDTFRTKINNLRSEIDKSPSVTSTLVEAVGSLTEDNTKLKELLSESNTRNKSLSTRMSELQEAYNLLSASVDSLQEKNSLRLKKAQENLNSIKSSYEEKISNLSEEVVSLRKRLAIEKRGMSVDTFLPILEGLTTTEEIDSKLDSVKHLGTRRPINGKNVAALTEGVTSKPTKLSKIVSSV